jgi:transcription elongation factor SPT5
MNNVYATKLQLVPVNEMVDCLRPRKAKLDIKLGMWVRVKRGNYGGDLGQIVEIPESGESVVVKLIPRLDYSKDTSSKRKKGSIRPPQKLFSTNDIKYRYF